MHLLRLIAFLCGLTVLATGTICGCTQTTTESAPTTLTTASTTTTTTLAFAVSSSAFSNNGFIPYKYAYTGIGTGENKSVPLSWSNVPAGTQYFALSMVDTSASNFIHWMAINMPSSTTSLSEGVSNSSMPAGSTELGNDYLDSTGGYDGPGPPTGTTHDYVTTIYALDSTVSGLSGNVTLSQFNSALSGKILAQTTITGKFTGP